MNLEMRLSGLLFLIIIILNILSEILGHGIGSDINSKPKLKKIHDDPRKFEISFGLLLIEHLSIIFLAIMLFLAFGHYNIVLGLIWLNSRVAEGLIQIFNRKKYWGLLYIGKQYSDTNGAAKHELLGAAQNIIKLRHANFAFAQILFSIGTLAYSVLFITTDVVPVLIGWFGIVASILYGIGIGIWFIKPKFQGVLSGGLLVLLFEIIIGGWLLFLS
ncbi:MAG: DUF4386 domain-containing protein [Candidatus Heimdallarchaeota archaeon]